MSPKAKARAAGSMLELWRPPRNAGDPLGCLATTYTFSPGLFDEQCLARFLAIESEPDREDLAFLLERETRLGSVYAGVLVDYTQAGVEHSLRWDVLPVRIPRGKQHAKLSLLAWSRCVRVLVGSANLTEPGYRTNFEVAGSIDLVPSSADPVVMADALGFLADLLRFAGGPGAAAPELGRAASFLRQVETLASGWKRPARSQVVRQRLIFNLPSPAASRPAQGALESAVAECRRRGGSPKEVWVASPFFDVEDGPSRVAAELCKSMARGGDRHLRLCVPLVGEWSGEGPARLGAPKTLLSTPAAYRTAVEVRVLPFKDPDKNLRAWHAKMMQFEGDGYSALMIGSSNFTSAGLGVGFGGNAEANLLTLVDHKEFGREAGELRAVWPEMKALLAPEAAEWLGTQADRDEEAQANSAPLPAGFLSATYVAGEVRKIVLRFDRLHLPDKWSVHAVSGELRFLLDRSGWESGGRGVEIDVEWREPQPPRKLRVEWSGGEAFWALNVQDGAALPPPPRLEQMTADDMLAILAAADPGAACRAWSRRQGGEANFDSELDAANPADLDPLGRYDLHATFLHRVRRRARVLAQLRMNLERPVWGRQALEWRLRGLIGVEALARRFLRELGARTGARGEALLTLADLLIVLREVEYRPVDGALSKRQFDAVFRPFLTGLASELGAAVDALAESSKRDHAGLIEFWKRVEERCRA